MTDSQTKILEKTNKAKLSDVPVQDFMNDNPLSLKDNYTIKGTIDAFRVHHLSGAPVIDFEKKVIGVVSEFDLLIQAASKPLSSIIDYQDKIISVRPSTTLKEVLVLMYKHKLKWMPVINDDGYLKGVVARIDVLSFIAKNAKNH